jgi:RNA polymerase sigma-70 factor (ECF subfamily)
MSPSGSEARSDTLEERVATLCARGEYGAATEAIVRDLGPGLCGYLIAVLRDDDAAQDVLADVAVHVLTALPRFRGDSTVRTWTYRIAWRTAMRNRRRGPQHRRAVELRSSLAEQLVAEVRQSTAAYRRAATLQWLERIRAELTPADQSLLTLRLDRDMSWSEVAQVMGVGDTAVVVAGLRKRYERIKDRLRKAAERDGVLAG